jgi:hypothetical protein
MPVMVRAYTPDDGRFWDEERQKMIQDFNFLQSRKKETEEQDRNPISGDAWRPGGKSNDVIDPESPPDESHNIRRQLSRAEFKIDDHERTIDSLRWYNRLYLIMIVVGVSFVTIERSFRKIGHENQEVKMMNQVQRNELQAMRIKKLEDAIRELVSDLAHERLENNSRGSVSQ